MKYQLELEFNCGSQDIPEEEELKSFVDEVPGVSIKSQKPGHNGLPLVTFVGSKPSLIQLCKNYDDRADEWKVWAKEIEPLYESKPGNKEQANRLVEKLLNEEHPAAADRDFCDDYNKEEAISLAREILGMSQVNMPIREPANFLMNLEETAQKLVDLLSKK